MRKPTVFVCSSPEGLPIAYQFARQLETWSTTVLWSEGIFHPGKTAAESLTEVADRVDFAVFVLTPDMTTGARKPRSRVPRPNIIFEMGFVAGSIGLPRTIIVLADPKRTELPIDLAGVMYVGLQPDYETDLPASIAPVTATIGKTIAELGLRSERRAGLSSCFISYSWIDKDFAARLHDDLEQVGVRCWLDAREVRTGQSISEQINRAIQAHDKLLIVLSKSSIRSRWVHTEIRKALELEQARQSTVLFPLRLDDAALTANVEEDIKQLRDRFVIDFSEWQDKGQYQRAFSRLVRDLAISASVESERTE